MIQVCRCQHQFAAPTLTVHPIWPGLTVGSGDHVAKVPVSASLAMGLTMRMQLLPLPVFHVRIFLRYTWTASVPSIDVLKYVLIMHLCFNINFSEYLNTLGFHHICAWLHLHTRLIGNCSCNYTQQLFSQEHYNQSYYDHRALHIWFVWIE